MRRQRFSILTIVEAVVLIVFLVRISGFFLTGTPG